MGWFDITSGEYPDNSCPQNNLYTCADVFSNYTDCGNFPAFLSFLPACRLACLLSLRTPFFPCARIDLGVA
jgi:hypothetical protein